MTAALQANSLGNSQKTFYTKPSEQVVAPPGTCLLLLLLLLEQPHLPRVPDNDLGERPFAGRPFRGPFVTMMTGGGGDIKRDLVKPDSRGGLRVPG